MITPSGAYVHAQQFVTTHYADWNVAYPIDFRQYYKKGSQEAEEHGFRTKIVLACELVDDAIEKGCPAHTFVFDRWYLCKTLTDPHQITREKLDWSRKKQQNHPLQG
jgi:hypothetical protein